MQIRKLMALVLSGVLSAGMTAGALPVSAFAAGISAAVSRIGGSDRYETAEETAESAYPKTKNVIIVSGENYPDALAASSLSGLLDAPILLNENSGTVNSYTQKALKDMGAENAVLIGGEGVLPSALESALENAGLSDVERISGSDRVDTALQVYLQGPSLASELTGTEKNWGNEVIVASGSSFADALSISPYAASAAAPVLLTEADGTLSEKCAAVLGSAEKTIIAGGTGVVDSSAEKEAGGQVLRLFGDDRYATSAVIASWMTGMDTAAAFQPSRVFTLSNTAFANGENYPDALAGSALQNRKNSPLLLMTETTEKSRPVLEYVRDYMNSVSSITVLGGEGAVTPASVTKILDAAGGTVDGDDSGTSTDTGTSSNTFTFTDSSVAASDSTAAAGSCTIDGTDLTISAAGTYTLTGTCSDGSVTIAKNTGEVTLILQNLNLTNTDSEADAIGAKSGDTLNLTVAAGTDNTLSNTGAVIYDDSSEVDNAPTLKMGDTGTISGTGTLNVINTQKNAVKGDVLTISDAVLNLSAGLESACKTDTVGSGVNCDTSLTVKSGTITVNAYNDGLHSDGTLVIDGGMIDIPKCEEGLEGNTVTVNDGKITIASRDDCINASGDSESDAGYGIIFNGGSTCAVTSSGDGFDSNGFIKMTGGTAMVFCSTNNDANTAVDYDENVGSFTITGGTLLAAGPNAGMGGAAPSDATTQTYVQFGNTNVAADTEITVKDSSGNALYSCTVPIAVSNVIYSGPGLVKGSTYSLYEGGSSLTTATAGMSNTTGGGQPGGNQPGGNQPGGRF